MKLRTLAKLAPSFWLQRRWRTTTPTAPPLPLKEKPVPSGPAFFLPGIFDKCNPILRRHIWAN